MAVKTRDELMDAIKAKLGDDTSDESLSLIEDVSDTLTNYDTIVQDKTDWKAKAEEIDSAWRQKYRDRFFSGGGESPIPEEIEQPEKPLTFEALFRTE